MTTPKLSKPHLQPRTIGRSRLQQLAIEYARANGDIDRGVYERLFDEEITDK